MNSLTVRGLTLYKTTSYRPALIFGVPWEPSLLNKGVMDNSLIYKELAPAQRDQILEPFRNGHLPALVNH